MRERPLILVCDDDPIIGIVAAAAIEGAGMDVLLASGGVEALDAFATSAPDAVLLDVMMPDLDGFEVCRRLRALPAGADLPILMMTALDDSKSIELAYECGATAFVTKPLHPLLLGHRIRFQLRAADAIREAQDAAARLSRAQTLARLAQWSLDPEVGRLEWSPATRLVFGDALVDPSRPFLDWVHVEDRARVERALARAEPHSIDYRLVLPGLGERIVHQEAALAEGPGAAGERRLLGTAQDVTDLRLAERTIQRMTLEDELTGLPNRDSMRKAVETALVNAAALDTTALLTIGLDNFTRVNEVFGRPAGDALLQSFARRLETRLGQLEESGVLVVSSLSRMLVGRAGADEFLVLLPGLRDAVSAARVVQKLLDGLQAPFALEHTSLIVTCSIGIASCTDDQVDADLLLERSAAAMHYAKLSGRNQFRFFTPSIQEGIERAHYVETALRAALATGENLALHYQPKVDLTSGRATGVEALVRWVGPGPRISPIELVTIAEATGLIIPLGEWVLRTGCMQAKAWQAEGILGVCMAINIAPRHFGTEDFVDRVAVIIDEVGLPAEGLELEITEGTMMQNPESVTQTLSAIKVLGARIALDDFGTGFSSLSYLTTLPIDTLKVDRSFVVGLGKSRKNDTITSAIVGLAQSLGIDVVVEGVETEEQRAFFEGRGKITIQGWLYAKAMPAAEATSWLRELASRQSFYLATG